MVSSYEAYKLDTAILLDWVSDSAERCSSKAPKKKGKAGNSPNSDILSQVELILVSKEPVIQAPVYVIKAGKRAVSVRKSCSILYQRYRTRTADDIQSNESHWAFVVLLEEIIEKLSRHSALQSSMAPAALPKMQVQVPYNVTQLSSAIHDSVALNNLFTHLTLEEPEEPSNEGSAESNAPRAPIQTKPIAASTPAASLQSVVVESLTVSTLCLYSDLKGLRGQVQGLWTDYMSGKTDLLSVSIATNAALSLARRWEDEMSSTWPVSKGAAKTLEVLQINIDKTELSEYPLLTQESLYLAAYKHLCSISASLSRASSGGSLILPPLRPREYDPATNRTGMLEEERFREDHQVLIHLLSDLQLFDGSELLAPTKDEIIRGLQGFLKERNVSVWVTFATQTLLDIMHTTRPNMVKAVDDVRKVGSHVVDTLKGYLESLSDNRRDMERAKIERMSRLSDHVRAWVLTDELFIMETLKGKAREPTSSEQAYFLYRHHPLLCGILATHYTFESHAIAIAAAREWGLIDVMHVYNAFRHHKDYSVQAWLDMDLAIAIHTREHLFFGEAPRRSMFERGSKYTLHQGLPITTHALNARATTRKRIQLTERRNLKEDSNLVKTLHSVYVDGSSLERATGKIEHLLMPEAKKDVKILVHPNPRLQPQWKAKKGKKGGKRKALKPTEYDAAQEPDPPISSSKDFLTTFHTALENEIPALLIDYITLCSYSQRFIQAIQGSLSAEAANYVTMPVPKNMDMRTFSDIHLICTYLMSIAVNMEVGTTERGTTEAEKKALLEHFADPLSAAASRVLREIGDWETMRVQGLLKGTGAGHVLEGLIAKV